MMRAGIAFLSLVTFATPALAATGEGGLFYPFLNLVLLIAVLVYFARAPVRKYFIERRTQIQDDLRRSAELRKEAEERYSRWQHKLVDLEAELEQIRVASRARAEAERDGIIADANAAAERIRNDAIAAIEHELRRSRETLRQEAADLALELAENLLREQVTDADRERLIVEFIERLERAPVERASTDSRLRE